MAKKAAPKKQPRYRFLRDDDGHDYLVLDSEVELFEELLCLGDDYQKFIEKFEDDRIGNSPTRYSFTDPQSD